ncbi:MAG: CPBP family intramembrane metalloprotease [Phycisphaerae bacterium]|jgi:membrane protease YdiL (CAAX protease family)|nr:CPBP family intramembrane metalloprotease [Phycisphaerae bacterium]
MARASVTKGTSARAASQRAADGYALRSQQPLEILVFLLPLIVLYELGLVLVLRSGGTVLDNKAHDAIRRIFDAVGVDAAAMSLPVLSLPGILLAVILILWQVLSRRSWQVDLRTVALMAVESAALAIPLVVLAQLVMQAFATPVPAAAPAGDAIQQLPVLGRLAVSIGAGLYEELIFRMVLIAVLHTLLVDVVRWKEGPAIALSIIISAVAFAAYHPLQDASGAIDWARACAYLVIGGYFGAVFAFRGFGVVVGAHASYDIAVLLLPRG